MVTVRVSRLSAQILAKALATAATMRQEMEAAAEEAATTAAVRVSRVGAQVLAKAPATVATQRQEMEAAAQEAESTAAVRVSRVGVQLLAKTPANVGVTRQEMEAVATDGTGAVPVRVSRVGVQILMKRPQAAPVPIALAAFLALFKHNWVTRPQVTSTWLTAISRNQTTLAETRRGQRGKPVRTLTYAYTVQRADVTLLVTQLRRHTSTRMQVPFYPEHRNVTGGASGQAFLDVDTTSRRFVAGGRVAIYPNCTDRELAPGDVDVYTIDTVFPNQLQMTTDLTDTYNTTYDVVPLVDVEKQPEILTRQITDQVFEVDIEYQEIAGPSMLDPSQGVSQPAGWHSYAGLPIWDPTELVQWTEQHETLYRRPGTDEFVGRKRRIITVGTKELQIQRFNLFLQRADHWKTLQFFDSRMGRLLPFWEVDSEHRWTLAAASGTFIDVVPDDGDFDLGFKDLVESTGYFGIVLQNDAAVYVRKISTVTVFGGQWRLTLDGGEPAMPTVNVNEVERIGVVRLKRFDSDTFTEEWDTNELCFASMTTIELVAEQDIDIIT